MNKARTYLCKGMLEVEKQRWLCTEWHICCTDTKINFTLKETGEYELRFEATDDAQLTSTVSKTFKIETTTGSTMTSTEVAGTILIVAAVLVLGGVVVYFIISKRKIFATICR